MRLTPILMLLGSLTTAAAQETSKSTVINLDSSQWKHDKESDSILLHADPKTGAMELLVRFPAGHVIAPHFHESNERLIVAEGQVTLKQDSGDTPIDAGGYAFLPAKVVQRLSCTSKTRCTFYLIWDGNPQSHPAK